MLKVRRKPGVLREIMATDAEKDAERQHIENVVQISNDFGRVIDSAKAVAESINT